MNRVWLLQALVLALALGLGGCKKKEGDSVPDPNPPVGEVDDSAGFYVRYITSEKYTYNVHKASDLTFTEGCTAAENEDILCYIEGEELDLYFHGMTLQYNVPSTMCSYVRFTPYWYFSYETGDGPLQVTVDTDKNGKTGIDTNDDGTIDTQSADYDTDGIVDTADTVCEFDHTASDGPNCCTGKYRSRTRTYDPTAETPGYSPPVVTENVAWGGAIASCIGGPAVDTQKKDKFLLPRSDMMFVEGSGINQEYKIEAPINKEKGTNLYVSNYFDTADHGGFAPPPLLTVSTAAVTVSPDQYYQFECLDRAEEVIARIRLQIREWNTEAAYEARVTAPTGHSGGGTETSPVSTVPNNDRADWKDFGLNFPGEFGRKFADLRPLQSLVDSYLTEHAVQARRRR